MVAIAFFIVYLVNHGFQKGKAGLINAFHVVYRGTSNIFRWKEINEMHTKFMTEISESKEMLSIENIRMDKTIYAYYNSCCC